MDKLIRQKQIVRLIALEPWQFDRVSLATGLGISEATVQRDLNELGARGYLFEQNPTGLLFLRRSGWEEWLPIKETTIRQMEILRFIHAHPKGVGAGEVIARFTSNPAEEISAKTVERALKELERRQFIQKENERYTVKLSLALPPLQLEAAEKTLLTEALTMRQLLSPLGDGIKALEAKLKLSQTLPEKTREAVVIHGRTPVQDLRRSYYCGRLEQCARTHQKILLLYRRAEEEAYEIQVKPLGVLYYWSLDNWYLAAQEDQEKGAIKTYAVDRILGIEERDEVFLPMGDFSLQEWYKYPWGVYRDGQPVKVIIRFYNYHSTLKRVREELGNRTTCVWREDEDGLVMEDWVDGLGEIAVWVRGFGPGAEVIEPQALRDRVQDDLEKLLQMYGG